MPEGRQWPKISIITPSYNQAKYIEETIRSVLLQGYPNLEYIIIDGGSTDNSVKIIKKYKRFLAYWVSKKDEGQANAINKGIQKSDGVIVAYLNSDDIYFAGTLSTIGMYFSRNKECRWACGSCIQFDMNGGKDIVYPVRRSRHYIDWLIYKTSAPQPATFWHRGLFKEYGFFNEKLRYCFDQEFCVRLIFGNEAFDPIDSSLAGFRLHPKSKTVSEGNLFAREWVPIRDKYLFDQKVYSKAIPAREIRQIKSFGNIIKSRKAAFAFERKKAINHLIKAIYFNPLAMISKDAIGCIRRIILP